MLEKKGMSTKEVKRKAHNESIPQMRKCFRRALADYFIQIIPMRKIQETNSRDPDGCRGL